MATPDIPDAHLPYVERLRRFLGDDTQLNTLLQVEESSDLFLYEALLDTIDEVNLAMFPTDYTLDNFPYWSILKLGAVLQVLTGKGILSARNTLTYRDSGGVTVQDYDVYGRYINYFNILITKYREKIFNFKRSVNVDAAYGGVYSEYANFSDIYDDFWSH